QPRAEALPRVEEVAEVRPAVPAADFAVTLGIDGLVVLRVAGVLDGDGPLAGEDRPVAGDPSGEDRVEEVDPSGHRLGDGIGRAHAHQVAGPVRGELRGDHVEELVHQLFGLAHAQAPDAVPGKVHLGQVPGGLAPQVGLHAALDDA